MRLRSKGTRKKAGPVIWEYLNAHRGKEYDLINYHASEALFKILGHPDPEMAVLNNLRWRCVSLDQPQESRELALQELKRLVDQRAETGR